MKSLMVSTIVKFFPFSLGFIVVCMALIVPNKLYGFEITPFKDKLFNYPEILKSEDNGDFLLVKYDKQVDLYARDQIPIRKVKQKYIKTGLRRHMSFEEFEYQGRNIEISFIAKKGAPEFTILFIHGAQGDRKLGMKDYSFGGNFNRLKNIAVRDRGLYITQTVRDFTKEGVEDTRALVRYLHDEKRAPKIILVCASMGGQICNKMAHNDADVARLSGIILLGAIPDKNLAKSHAISVGLPIVIAHGNDDVVYPWTIQRDVYKTIKTREPKYPIHLVLFDTGRHGTPIRMIDWRRTLNWLAKRS